MSNAYDLIVIGAGPGGYVAAIRAAQLGLRVACIDKAELGGVCLNWGCIPTKALIASASLYREMQGAKEHGFKVDKIKVDWEKLIKRSRKISQRLSRGIAGLFKKYKVTSIAGEARIERPGVVVVGEARYEAKDIIVATGARARTLGDLALDEGPVWSARTAMVAESCPDKIVILGAGAIGCEFAYFYRAMGAEVTLVEMADRLLPMEDDDSSAALKKAFEDQGIKVRLGFAAQVDKVKKDEVKLRLEPVGGGEAEEVKADRLLVAIGVQGNIENLGLEAAGVEVDARRGAIVVDADGRTTCPGIWAIGDVAEAPALAHKASAEGRHVASLIAQAQLGDKAVIGAHDLKPVDLNNVPSCTYCEPQVASIGQTERALKAEGRAYRVGKFPYMANGKALGIGDEEGFIKVLFDTQTGELLGAHLFGTAATDLISEAVLVRSAELTETDILGAMHPHPTLSEVFYEAVAVAYKESTHW